MSILSNNDYDVEIGVLHHDSSLIWKHRSRCNPDWFSAERQITQAMADQYAKEIDKKIMERLLNMAGGPDILGKINHNEGFKQYADYPPTIKPGSTGRHSCNIRIGPTRFGK